MWHIRRFKHYQASRGPKPKRSSSMSCDKRTNFLLKTFIFGQFDHFVCSFKRSLRPNQTTYQKSENDFKQIFCETIAGKNDCPQTFETSCVIRFKVVEKIDNLLPLIFIPILIKIFLSWQEELNLALDRDKIFNCEYMLTISLFEL